MQTVRELIDRQALERGDSPFLLSPETTDVVTFGTLRDRARAVGGVLETLELPKGARVAALLDNGLFAAELFLGTLYAARVPVLLNPQASPSHTAYSLAHSDAAAVFAGTRHAPLVRSALGARRVPVVPVGPGTGVGGSGLGDGGDTLPPLDPDDEAVLTYTSGTTGDPKGVLLSHRSVLAASANVVRALRLTSDDRALCVLPLHHRNAQNTTLSSALVAGASVVMPPRFDVTTFWQILVRFRCTWSALVPTLIAQLLSRPEAPPGREALAHVRFVRTSGAALAPATHREFEARFGLPLLEGMGATEAGSVIFSSPLPPGRRKAGSPGLPVGFQVRVVGDAGQELPACVAGELHVRGPSVMTGYLKDPAATAEVLAPDGWLRTGDIGYLDTDGYVFLTGRARDFVKKGAVKIALREIDEALARHPAVLEAAAVGIDDEYLGNDIAACLVLRPGSTSTPSELLAFCERELGPFRTPARIDIVDALPKGPLGKVERGRIAIGDPRPAVLARPRPDSTAPPVVRSPVEQAVAEAWRSVLDRDPIGLHDDFFAIGGDSLQALRILVRLGQILPVSLTFGAFVEHPTIAGQARLVGQALLARDDAAGLLEEVERLSDAEAVRRLAEVRDAPCRAERNAPD